MKKAINITLLILYTFFSTGISVSIHFCRAVSTQLPEVSYSLLPEGNEDKDCCTEKCGPQSCFRNLITVKIKDLHKSEVENSLKLMPPSDDLCFLSAPGLPAANTDLSTGLIAINSGPPLYLNNCTLLI